MIWRHSCSRCSEVRAPTSDQSPKKREAAVRRIFDIRVSSVGAFAAPGGILSEWPFMRIMSSPPEYKSGADESIIFIGGNNAGGNSESPVICCRGKTGDLRHEIRNIRPEENK